MTVNRHYVHARMRELHEWIVDHDCKAGPEHGCQCSDWREEMRMLYLILNPHPRSFEPRAGPQPAFRGGRDDPLGEVLNDSWWFLKQTESND